MKKIIAIMAIFIAILNTTDASAQRGNYGTIQPITAFPATLYGYVAGVITLKSSDTLSNTDTGLARWNFQNTYDMLFDYTVTKLTGTVGGTALLQGSDDNSNWHTITGSTTYCADCQGASATVTNTAGTKHYQWYVPHSTTGYKYWQVQVITTGTMTATYSGSVYYSY